MYQYMKNIIRHKNTTYLNNDDYIESIMPYQRICSWEIIPYKIGKHYLRVIPEQILVSNKTEDFVGKFIGYTFGNSLFYVLSPKYVLFLGCYSHNFYLNVKHVIKNNKDFIDVIESLNSI